MKSTFFECWVLCNQIYYIYREMSKNGHVCFLASFRWLTAPSNLRTAGLAIVIWTRTVTLHPRVVAAPTRPCSPGQRCLDAALRLCQELSRCPCRASCGPLNHFNRKWKVMKMLLKRNIFNNVKCFKWNRYIGRTREKILHKINSQTY